jgi:hypothetical protein
VFGYGPDGERAWSHAVDGFATELGVDGDTVVVPAAQHFRVRDSSEHGLEVFDIEDGRVHSIGTAGVVTAVDCERDQTVAIEEPVVYHDEGTEHGSYRLHTAFGGRER